ncbi:EAL domain-containing protein [Pelobacter seleniigenes]|uniref:EAL domain-containing protein n=1 Tax=Pelobacter seleniigenes TaxID=407188 RepID=UPI0004A779C4|nr:EAL domain-containing protein [Pelobacter seleniigenes]
MTKTSNRLFSEPQILFDCENHREWLAFAKQIIATSPMPTFVIDGQQRLLLWNSACAQLTGLQQEQVPAAVEAVGQDDTLSPVRDLVYGGLPTVPVSRRDWVNDLACRNLINGWFTGLNGKDRYLVIHTDPVFLDNGSLWGYVRRVDELTEAIESRKLVEKSRFDKTTGLPDRSVLAGRLGQSILRAAQDYALVALYHMKIVPYKTSAQALSDQELCSFLQIISEKLKYEVRAIDMIAYNGHFQFIIAAANFARQDQVVDLANRLQTAVSKPIPLAGVTCSVACKVGISVFPEDGGDATTLLEKAEKALGEIKYSPGGALNFFNQHLNAQYTERFTMQLQLSHALQRNEFSLHYQPKACLRTGWMTGVEVLLRWTNQLLGAVSPALFIPVAERMDLIDELGKWVISTACAQYAAWQKAGLTPPPMAINVSGQQLKDSSFCQFIQDVLRRTGIDSAALELEVTETAVIGDLDAAIKILGELKQMGVTISLDDFGTGYSSLSYLRQLPIDKIKIDRSFIQDVTCDPSSNEITKAATAIAHALNLKVIAEGVEDKDQLKYLQRLGCDEIQGFLYSRPVPGAELESFLRNPRHLNVGQYQAGERRVLIVDDEPSILNSLGRELSLSGCEVETALDAEQGLSILAQRPVAVVISDYQLPGLNGVDFLERVKKIYPKIVRIALSGGLNFNMITENVNRGAIFKFIAKPWDREVLQETLEEGFKKYKKNLHIEVC